MLLPSYIAVVYSLDENLGLVPLEFQCLFVYRLGGALEMVVKGEISFFDSQDNNSLVIMLKSKGESLDDCC